jgi:uncharacterized protein
MSRDRDDATLDLRSLDLAPGEARELEVPVPIGELTIGGQRYVTDPPAPVARIEVSQSASGWHMRLRVQASLTGPCWRCLEPARVGLSADVRDFAAFGREGAAGFDEDLDCEYLAGDALDVGAMARDALVDLIPAMILCRDDCRGLCPTCGANLNDGACDCPPPARDSRWDALRGVAERLREEG